MEQNKKNIFCCTFSDRIVKACGEEETTINKTERNSNKR